MSQRQSRSCNPMATGIALAAERTGRGTKASALCDGGAQEAVITNSQNTQASTYLYCFRGYSIHDAAGRRQWRRWRCDTYTVTFSGEAATTGGGSWEIRGQVSVNGGAFVDIDPVDSNTFQSGNPRQTHTMTWCRRLDCQFRRFPRGLAQGWRRLGDR